MKNSVTIGLTVLNEEKNLHSLLTALLNQETPGFTIAAIRVISDGSTDKTAAILKDFSLRYPLVQPMYGTRRLGKPARLNSLFATGSTDAIVILDGDVSIPSKHTIRHLVEPIFNDVRADLTSGKADYLPPRTYFEKIMSKGIDMWCEVKEQTSNAEMYTCEGQIRAFSRKLYKQLTFPEYSAEDVYPYLFCKKNALIYRYTPEAIIYYGLPATLTDYIKQHTRFLHSKAIQSRNFTEDIITQTYVIGIKKKFMTFLKHFFKSPFMVSLYTFFLVIPKIEVLFETESVGSKWAVIASTKK